MSGAGTILWKEAHELYLRKGKPARATWVSLVFACFIGIVAPLLLILGLFQFRTPAQVGFNIFLLGLGGGVLSGYFTPLSLAVDQTAGERERHTLETMLAGPLTDRAIWTGKLGLIVLSGMVQALVIAVLASLVALVLRGPGAFPALLAIPLGPLAAGLLGLPVTALGIAIGSKASTVKAGQQTFSLALMPFFLLLNFSFSGIAVVLNELSLRYGRSFITLAIPLAALVYVVLTGLAILWADRRFRRAKLLQVKV